jgi:hypothetical protein
VAQDATRSGPDRSERQASTVTNEFSESGWGSLEGFLLGLDRDLLAEYAPRCSRCGMPVDLRSPDVSVVGTPSGVYVEHDTCPEVDLDRYDRTIKYVLAAAFLAPVLLAVAIISTYL